MIFSQVVDEQVYLSASNFSKTFLSRLLASAQQFQIPEDRFPSPLGVISDDASVDEAAQVKFLRSKMRHDEPF